MGPLDTPTLAHSALKPAKGKAQAKGKAAGRESAHPFAARATRGKSTQPAAA
jgi:hypothetical protein